jgi:glycosyltransferase involved in cell wall biosynthesis
MKISVIVPSYNQGDYIENCIKSVLGQTYTDWELIIQDGASTDKTYNICEHYENIDPRIVFTSEKDKGFADAVNKGLNKATGELAVIQSSDDFFAHADVFTEVCKVYAVNKRLIVIAGASVVVDEKLEHLSTQERTDKYVPVENIYTTRDHFSQGATFFSLKRAKYIDQLDPNVDMVADTDFWVRLACYDPIIINSVFQTSQIWGCVMVQPQQRSMDLSKFYLGRSQMACGHVDNERILFDRSFKMNHANAVISVGVEHYCGIGKDPFEFYALYEHMNGKTFEVQVEQKSQLDIKKIAKLLLNRSNKISKPKNSKAEYYSDANASPHYSYKWF